MLPSITIAVPAYNYGRFLPACLDSLLAQEGVKLDVVIIDDASTDGTAEICAAYAERDSRIRIVRHETNIGYTQTFNRGVAEARGKYFSIVSSDDMLTPGALRRACVLMEVYPGVGLVYGGVVNVNVHGLKRYGFHKNKPPRLRLRQRSAVIFNGREWNRLQCAVGKNAIIGSEAVLRTDVQLLAGNYDESIPHANDVEMWLRIAAIADIGYIRADQMIYRVHADSLQRTVHSGRDFDLDTKGMAFRSAYQKGCVSWEELAMAERAIEKQRRGLAPGEQSSNFFRREIMDRITWRVARWTGIPV